MHEHRNEIKRARVHAASDRQRIHQRGIGRARVIRPDRVLADRRVYPRIAVGSSRNPLRRWDSVGALFGEAEVRHDLADDLRAVDQ
jgi:hypothetical protein